MTAAEASRQYQRALEHRRRVIAELGDTISAEDEVAAACADVVAARGQLIDALVERERPVLEMLA